MSEYGLAKAERQNRLTLCEKCLFIPVSCGAIALGAMDMASSGFGWVKLLPCLIGGNNLALLLYRKSPRYKRVALVLGAVLGAFTLLAIGLVGLSV